MDTRNFPKSSQYHMQSSGGVAVPSAASAIPPSHKLKASSSTSSAPSTSTAANSPHLHMRRRQSLLLQIPPGVPGAGHGHGHGHVHHPQLLHIPIPPTLQNSPLLQSPNSVFRRQYDANRTPGEEEERWLRDTIPMNVPASQSGATGGSASRGSAGVGHGHGHGHSGPLAAPVPPRTDALRPPVPTIPPRHAPGGAFPPHAYPTSTTSGRSGNGGSSSSGLSSRTH